MTLILSLLAVEVAFLADISEKERKQRDNEWLVNDKSLMLSRPRIYLRCCIFLHQRHHSLDFPKNGREGKVRRLREIKREFWIMWMKEVLCTMALNFPLNMRLFSNYYSGSDRVTWMKDLSRYHRKWCPTSACGTLSSKTKPYFKSHKVGVWVVASYICIYMWLVRKRRREGRLPRPIFLHVLAKCNFD